MKCKDLNELETIIEQIANTMPDKCYQLWLKKIRSTQGYIHQLEEIAMEAKWYVVGETGPNERRLREMIVDWEASNAKA